MKRQKHIQQLAADLRHLVSESTNPSTSSIDTLTSHELALLFNREDQKVIEAINLEVRSIAAAIDAAVVSLTAGGRLIYCGAGTSGRLGVLDAAECPPTFGVEPGLVIALIAGGQEAIFVAQEGSEDQAGEGAKDLNKINISSKDIVVGITASGRTPYVLGAIARAKAIGAKTVSISCNPCSPLEQAVDIAITPVVGAEVLTGSSRLKAGSAQKMILNMISTGTMIGIGKCFGHHMVDLQATNDKLKARALRLVCETTGASQEEAIEVLLASSWQVKPSILMYLKGISYSEAQACIAANGGHLTHALIQTSVAN